MQPFIKETGVGAPLPLANVDTDMIIPKQFLKTIAREGLGKGLFYDMRSDASGKAIPGFVLDDARFARATILIARENFGCGSSREHAPWALLDFGIRCVIAPSFGDIFAGNCIENGMAPVVLPAEVVETLMTQAGSGNARFTIDMEAQVVLDAQAIAHPFTIDAEARRRLLAGEDPIAATLHKAEAIAAFERARQASATGWM